MAEEKKKHPQYDHTHDGDPKSTPGFLGKIFGKAPGMIEQDINAIKKKKKALKDIMDQI